MTKTKDDYLVDCILCNQKLAEVKEACQDEKYMLESIYHNCQEIKAKSDSETLAQDTIRIALKTVGYQNVDSMTQFEQASALLDMAQELAALTDKRHATMNFETATEAQVRRIA